MTSDNISYHLALFGFSGSEILIIAVVALLVIGPKELPPFVRAVMALWRRLKLMIYEFQKTFRSVVDDLEMEREISDIKNTMLSDDMARALTEPQKAISDARIIHQEMYDQTKKAINRKNKSAKTKKTKKPMKVKKTTKK